jgi:hypothetical protein
MNSEEEVDDASGGGNISNPGCPGRWKRSVNDP